MAEEQHNRPRLSVVMPNYNHGRFIGAALGAVLAQTRPADEIIVIDDASDDDSVDIVARLAAGRDNLTLVRRKRRGGAVSALNEGLERATGDVVAFPAADDLVLPDFLAETAAMMERFPDAPFCSACVAMIDAEGGTLGTRPVLRPMRASGYARAAEASAMLGRGDNFFLGHVTLYRRSRVVELGGFDASLGAATDAMLQRRLAVRWGFAFIPKVLGCWRMHGTNYSVGSVCAPDSLDQLIEACQRVISAEPPGLFPQGYGELFERRMRFFAARQALVQHGSGASADELATILRLARATPVDRLALQLFHRLGAASVTLSLGWLAMRLRPLALTWLGSEYLHRAFARGPHTA